MHEEKKEEQIEELEEEKKKKSPWWESVPPIILIGGGAVVYLALRSIMQSDSGKNQYVLLIGLVGLILFIISKTKPSEEPFVTPKEAELLVERELQRKIAWEQFPLMTTYQIGPNTNIVHRDARGMYYGIAVELNNPYELSRYFLSYVMIKGPERGFTTMHELTAPFKGTEFQQEKTIMPEWMRRSRDYPLLEKLFGRYGGF